MLRFIADSFAWPLRKGWGPRLLGGSLLVLLSPVLFIPLLGYAIEATRTADADPASGPPRWRLSARLLTDGLWTALAILLVSSPFLLVFNSFSSWIFGLHMLGSNQIARSAFFAHVLALIFLALPWGLLMLLVMPHATAAFARSGRPRDMFDFASAVRHVKRGFAAWNLAAAAIVTAWAVGLSAAGVLCVGVLPGIFYAILVSAHASAALHDPGAHPSAR